ncbi:MAG TPA: magnesium transporter CorA family protein [Candidatus Thermoplasmatota archaeon]|nr:magnesium transporter CorA family protein [Candidatus Thermoplasmatota archaeon]
MKVLAFQQGAWRESGEITPEAARDLAWGPTLVWIRLEGLEQKKLESLGVVFDLHPLALEDVMSHRQRPKVEDYPNLTFVVARAPRWDRENDEMSWLTVGIFLGPDFLITCCTDPVAELDMVEKRLLQQKVGHKGASIDHAFYQVIDSIVDSYFPIMDELEDRIESLEEGVIESAERHELQKIQDLKHIISQNRKTIFPMRETMVALERGEYPNIRDETRLYLRDVADHMTRLSERLEHVKEVAVLCQETWNATLANQTNIVVRRLTAVTVLVLVPNLIAQLFGMNLTGIPPWTFWAVTTGTFAVTIGGVLLARWRKWL